MKYVLQNIRTLAKNEKFIFAVMLICVFVSAWVMTFSYGLYHNYAAMLDNEAGKGYDIQPEITEGMTLTRKDLVRFFDGLSPATLDAMNTVFIQSGFDYTDKYGDIVNVIAICLMSIKI